MTAPISALLAIAWNVVLNAERLSKI